MCSSIYPALGFAVCLAVAGCLSGQTKPAQDVLVFVDGEKLIGELKSATDSKVVFKSDMGFEVTVPWAKIQELHSQNKFAAIHKDLILRNEDESAKVPQGTLEMANQKLEVTTAAAAAPRIIPVNEVSNVVPEQAFEHAMHKQGLLEGWTGQVAFGTSITEATVSNQAVTSSVELSRADPSENWLRVRNRTTFTFNSAYGKTTQSGVPDTKISLFHSDLVHDYYLKPRWFVFAGASFDHNYSQGLDLLQAYSGGLGAVIIKTERTDMDARAGIGFLQQRYSDPALNRNLVGSRFGETFSHRFAHGVVLYEQAGIRPSWNETRNFFGDFLLSLNAPVYRRLGVSVSSFDSYVNNPPPSFRKNSFQVTLGVTYAFK